MTLKTMITNLYNNVKQDLKGQRGKKEQWQARIDMFLFITVIICLIEVILFAIVSIVKCGVGVVVLILLFSITVNTLILIYSNRKKIHEREK